MKRVKGAMAALLVVGAMAATVPADAVGGGNAMRRWAATMGGGKGKQTLSLAEAVDNARNYDMVVGLQKTMGPYLAAMRAANPGVELIAYVNGMYLQQKQGTLRPDSWYAHDASGQKVTSLSQGNYLMDPTNSNWVQDRMKKCRAAISKYGFDGCYLDMLGTGTMTPDYVSSPPVNPATGDLWTLPDWINATSALASAVREGNHGKLVVGNGLGNGSLYFDPAKGPTSTLLGSLDAANAQGWLRGTSVAADQFRSETNWRKDVDMLVDAASHGQHVMAMTKVWDGTGTPDQIDSVHRYAVASFLLGTDGTQYFYFSAAGSQAAHAEDHPYDHVDIGMPVEPYHVDSGAYVRRFTRGVAVVNPTKDPVTVDLGGTFTDLDGATVTAVTLVAKSGNVFTAG